MPIKILSKHGIIERKDDLIELKTRKFSFQELAEIKMLCEAKVHEFVSQKGLGVWDYRFLDSEYVSDSLRYRVLKEANGICALCGCTKDMRPLDVDHIVPRSKGGKTVYENLQVLCSKCNRSKNNKDDTDFRTTASNEKDNSCIFCNVKKSRVILENEYAIVIEDSFPVTKHHSLVIPKRHFKDYFDILQTEQNAIHDLLRIRRKSLLEKDESITGFNVGINAGNDAGQTINHCHIHLIPRRKGDMENPKGGVRGVIPDKMHY
jgi:diadenosine tetraphosphate (Ap4A) HIT family hydrolase